MADNTTSKPPEKKIKTATPISKSCTMCWIMDQDTYKLKDVMEASKLTRYLSPLGRNLIKKSLLSNKPLDLKAINQTVMEKDNGGNNHYKGQPKKGDEKDKENGAGDIANKEASPNEFSIEENIAEETINKSD